LHGYVLSFSASAGSEHVGGAGNICKVEIDAKNTNKYASQVHGSIFTLTKPEKEKLDALELAYDSVLMEVWPYEEDYEKSQNSQTETKLLKKYMCYVCILTPEKAARLLQEKATNSKAFTPHFQKDAKPGVNYLQTLIRGATEIGLEKDYIEYLKAWPSIGFRAFEIEKVKWPTDPVRLFYMSEVEKSKNSETGEKHIVIKGIVFDMLTGLPGLWAKMFFGKDVTMLFAKRWAWSNDENTKDLKHLEEEQKAYIHDQLWLLTNGYGVFGKLAGRLHPDEANSLESYDW